MGVEYHIAFTLPGSPGRVLAIALSRRVRDYSDAERDLLLRARPFLIQAWRNAIQHTALRDELMRLSERTVQKHLERSYRALGVGSRPEAAGVVWSLAPPAPPSGTRRRVRLEEIERPAEEPDRR